MTEDNVPIDDIEISGQVSQMAGFNASRRHQSQQEYLSGALERGIKLDGYLLNPDVELLVHDLREGKVRALRLDVLEEEFVEVGQADSPVISLTGYRDRQVR